MTGTAILGRNQATRKGGGNVLKWRDVGALGDSRSAADWLCVPPCPAQAPFAYLEKEKVELHQLKLHQVLKNGPRRATKPQQFWGPVLGS